MFITECIYCDLAVCKQRQVSRCGAIAALSLSPKIDVPLLIYLYNNEVTNVWSLYSRIVCHHKRCVLFSLSMHKILGMFLLYIMCADHITWKGMIAYPEVILYPKLHN